MDVGEFAADDINQDLTGIFGFEDPESRNQDSHTTECNKQVLRVVPPEEIGAIFLVAVFKKDVEDITAQNDFGLHIRSFITKGYGYTQRCVLFRFLSARIPYGKLSYFCGHEDPDGLP